MKQLFRRICLTVTLVAVGCLFTTPASAQVLTSTASARPALPSSPLNLTLSPVNLIMTVEPGQVATASVKIRNNASQNEVLKIAIGTFEADATGQQPILRDPRPEDTFIEWMKVDQPEVTVPAGEWQTIDLEFTPPPEAALSYYYSILISRVADEQLDQAAVVKGTVAVLVLTTVPSPNARQELQLESVLVRRPILEFLPQEIVLNIRNTGNVHVAPTGNIFIDGQNTQDLAVLPINPNGYYVLPGSTREFVVPWDDGFPVWKQDELKWDLDAAASFRWGRYTGTVLMVYDNGKRDVPIETTVSFWVIPFRLILAGIAILTVPPLLVYVIMRLAYRKREKTA